MSMTSNGENNVISRNFRIRASIFITILLYINVYLKKFCKGFSRWPLKVIKRSTATLRIFFARENFYGNVTHCDPCDFIRISVLPV